MPEQKASHGIGAWTRAHRGKPRRTGGAKSGNDASKKDAGKNARRSGKKPGKKPLIVLGIVLVLLAIVAFVWWFMTRNEVSTDDAYTDGDAVTIAPKVSGYVTQLNINDNVFVHKGDLMVQIDPRDYAAQVDQARAQLGLAKAQLLSAQAQLDIARVQYPAQYQQARAQIETANANFARAQADYDRQHGVDPRATTQQNIDTATDQQRVMHADVMSAQAQLKTASLVPQQIRQAVASVDVHREQVAQAEAQLDTAQLNLAWCDLHAPSDGWVTRRNVQFGSFLQAGTSLFTIVTPQEWITANFKESQLTRMRPGDKVKISVDAYPNLELHGHVDSIQLGSGSRFSAFPAENATGNFVKIVQRVPVKIVIDDGLPGNRPLPLGLSVVPTVYLTD
ncbi:HlyD family secretion protein [Paraburkholderia lycopersici]|uniref:Membrane fusion protein, multidrug efflux system n=1 Tax=Paraburkholderia lycopersici TaxID=416944 RepID=A0A1G7D0C4_9BURK|nr:HlyD family secretion protein [Paraburkholderia lycopersici]SDE44969.1 membrane fusion protein, multidrug efflux system [Paraburkholderia lycopersici]